MVLLQRLKLLYPARKVSYLGSHHHYCALSSSRASPSSYSLEDNKSLSETKWDALIIGGGHNGLIAAAYLARSGKRVCVLERRSVLGGAAVTEEIYPGFHYSRASYVLSLLRPQIIEDLELTSRHGLVVYPRDPGSFTPTLTPGKSLVLGSDDEANQREIAKFSKADAEAFPRYNRMLEKYVGFFTPFLDEVPPDPKVFAGTTSSSSSITQRLEAAASLLRLGHRSVTHLGKDITDFIEFMTAPADKILNRWFESDILKATLATDAIIGAKMAPSTPGSAYILFHHVMGEVNGIKGMWGHIRGGMGGVSKAIAASAVEAGATLVTEAHVREILVEKTSGSSSDGSRVRGIQLENGQIIHADTVLSNASPTMTFLDLVPTEYVDLDLRHHLSKSWNCESASTKINVALDKLPNFVSLPNSPTSNSAMPHHRGTIHFESSMEQIEAAFLEGQSGRASKRPVIEMNLPSVLDDSIAPTGKHVALLFVQYTPYDLIDGDWADAQKKEQFATRVFDVIEQYAPGFKNSILHYEILTPPDLEKIFALPRGNIFHGAMGLDQLLWLRPFGGMSNYRSSIKGLYLCGAGTHPGGGVMGAPGRNAAHACLRDWKNQRF